MSEPTVLIPDAEVARVRGLLSPEGRKLSDAELRRKIAATRIVAEAVFAALNAEDGGAGVVNRWERHLGREPNNDERRSVFHEPRGWTASALTQCGRLRREMVNPGPEWLHGRATIRGQIRMCRKDLGFWALISAPIPE